MFGNSEDFFSTDDFKRDRKAILLMPTLSMFVMRVFSGACGAGHIQP
jgi:hypothetical protein